MNISWDGAAYTSNFSFVHQYGQGVIELIEAERGSAVLDLGCGNGALSKALCEAGYRVTGMDASPELLKIARKDHPEIEFIQADAASFSLAEPVDVVFSNAVLHWVDRERQRDMLRCVYDALAEYGEFVFEMGGCGNNDLIHQTLEQVFAEHGFAYKMPFYFPTIGEYAALLEQAGFQVKLAVLFDRPTELKGEDGMKAWIKLFLKTPFSVVKEEAERERMLDEAADRLRKKLYIKDKWYADYVRLRIRAIRARVRSEIS